MAYRHVIARIVIGGILFLTFHGALVVAETLTLPGGGTAIVYIPSSVTNAVPSPLLMALHGMRGSAQRTCDKWKSTADSLSMILVCPQGSEYVKGYTRTPVDDRDRIVAFRDLVGRRYHIDHYGSVLVGFSKGGNFAIELGIRYPYKFRTVVSLFGFYTGRLDDELAINVDDVSYDDSFFYLVSGEGAYSQKSVEKGASLLKRLGVHVETKIYRHLRHAYPSDLTALIRQVRSTALSIETD